MATDERPEPVAAVRLTVRQLFVAAAALRYALGNADDLNESLCGDESNGDEEVIRLTDTANNNSVAGTTVDEDEIRSLFALFVCAAESINT